MPDLVGFQIQLHSKQTYLFCDFRLLKGVYFLQSTLCGIYSVSWVDLPTYLGGTTDTSLFTLNMYVYIFFTHQCYLA